MNRCNNSLFFPNIYFWHDGCLLATIFHAYFFRGFNSFLILYWPPSHFVIVSSTTAQLASSYPINPQYVRVFRPTVNVLSILHVCVSSYGRRVALLVDYRHYRWFLTVEGHPILSMWLITSQQYHFHSFLPKYRKRELKT